ncbi:MAG: hypothetical protein U5J95_06315 [Balneolaceae bacterium]|nr:hypothetical protein [Balneolaceae bacterium]
MKRSTLRMALSDFEDGWVHLRKSNTEPIIRVYSEGKSVDQAEALANRVKEKVLK